MNGSMDVTARIAMLQGRIAGFESRVASRGGGRVGSGMEAALAAAEAELGGGPRAASMALPLAEVTGPGSGPSAAAPAGAWSAGLPEAGRRWAPAIEQAATRHGVPSELLGALVWTESGFDPGARSPAGAIGLGQLMPATAAELGVDPQDPTQNLDGAARYLRDQLDRFGDTSMALAAYNAGPGRVAAAGGVPAIEETTNYVTRVTQRAAALGGRA